MRAVRLQHRGRHLAAAVAALLTVAAVVLAVMATVGQQQAASPLASAAHPARERTLGSMMSPASPFGITVSGPRSREAVVGLVLPRSIPVSLGVPSIGIHNASLVRLSLANDGSIRVPPLEAKSPAGWYVDSPTPGQLGPSVILGHVDSATAGPAIFYRLGSLRPGDTITVTRADHTVALFRVDSVEQYPKSKFPTMQVYGDTDHAALRLITCGGKFNPAKGSYDSNIVVYAHLASSHPA